MKYRFLILVLVLVFAVLGCGDDPDEFLQNDDDGISETGDETGELPDSVNADDESGNGGADEESGKPDSGEEEGKTDNDPGNGDTSDTGANDDGGDAAPDGDDSADTSDTDTNDTGSDTDTNDTAADTDTNDTGADTDTNDTDSDTDSGEEDLTIELPYGSTVDKKITLSTKINKIDVLLMVDRSGLMSAAHNNLKANVKTAIFDAIREKIADPAFGLVKLGVVENGDAYELAQYITKDPNDLKNAVDTISSATNGSETYHNLALWEAATGEANTETIVYANPKSAKNAIAAADCSGQEGSRGGACFRENAMPVFIMMTNEKFWEKSKLGSNWSTGSYKTNSIVNDSMNAINAKFIGVYVETNSSTNPAQDFERIAKATDSIKAADSYFNTSVSADSTDFSAKIAEQVNSLTENILLKVKADIKHVDNEYGVADTTKFVKSFYPSNPQTVKAGTPLILDTITFENKDYDNPDCEPHNFKVTVEVTGEGLVLDSREITVVVPGKDCDGGQQ